MVLRRSEEDAVVDVDRREARRGAKAAGEPGSFPIVNVAKLLFEKELGAGVWLRSEGRRLRSVAGWAVCWLRWSLSGWRLKMGRHAKFGTRDGGSYR